MGTGRRQNEDGSTAAGYLVDAPEASDSKTTQRESDAAERDRIAWNLPIPRRARLPLESVPAVPADGPHERVDT